MSDQRTVPAQFVAVNVTDEPGQTTLAEGVTRGASGVFTLTFHTLAKQLMQPIPTRQIAVYLVVCWGFTRILNPVSPFDHTTVPTQPVAVSVTGSFRQTSVAEPVITGGSGCWHVSTTGCEKVGIACITNNNTANHLK
ncbi:hypothetical protein [Spirosoma pulveris]